MNSLPYTIKLSTPENNGHHMKKYNFKGRVSNEVKSADTKLYVKKIT
jgi:hypothetical protein